MINGGSLYRRAHFAEKSWRGILEFQRNSQTRISIPDTPTAETAVTIAQIMSLIIRPYYVALRTSIGSRRRPAPFSSSRSKA